MDETHDSSVHASPVSSSRNVYIGCDDNSANGFNGLISNVLVHARALTFSEIQLLHVTNGNAVLERRPSALYVPAAVANAPTGALAGSLWGPLAGPIF